MDKRTGRFAGVALSALAWAAGVRAQTPRNPISTKPEGTAPTCSYTGSITNGQPSSTSACTPGAVPGTDPNLSLPATQRFPYPGEAPAPASPVLPNPETPAAPGAQTPSPASNAAQRFPYPGEAPSDGTPAPPLASRPGGSSPPLQDAGSSGSSSSSSSSSSSQTDPGYSSSGSGGDRGTMPDDDPNAPMPTPHHSASRKKLPPPEKALTQDEKEAEDLQVAGFYQNDGNFKAAYDRAREAVSLVADDADAHLALADAARKLGKLDEAETNYKKTLTLDPVPKTRKAAERALKEMSGS